MNISCIIPFEQLRMTDIPRVGGKVAFMIGNEGAGLSPDLLNLATQKISIPMPGKIESLNAAAATAICLFEVVRQRSKS